MFRNKIMSAKRCSKTVLSKFNVLKINKTSINPKQAKTKEDSDSIMGKEKKRIRLHLNQRIDNFQGVPHRVVVVMAIVVAIITKANEAADLGSVLKEKEAKVENQPVEDTITNVNIMIVMIYEGKETIQGNLEMKEKIDAKSRGTLR